MSRSTALREAIKTAFYPFALKQGFVQGKASSMFTPFRRTRGGMAHVFDIQWEKSGRPCFVINFGEAPGEGVTFQGRLVPADEIEPVHCPLNGRLQRWKGGSLRTWFQPGKPWPETLRTLRWAYSPHEVATQVIECFGELETWWETKREGPHLYFWQSAG